MSGALSDNSGSTSAENGNEKSLSVLASIFSSLDSDGDGRVQRADLIAALRTRPDVREFFTMCGPRVRRAADVNATPRAIVELFAAVDANDSKYWSWSEFRTFFERRYGSDLLPPPRRFSVMSCGFLAGLAAPPRLPPKGIVEESAVLPRSEDNSSAAQLNVDAALRADLALASCNCPLASSDDSLEEPQCWQPWSSHLCDTIHSFSIGSHATSPLVAVARACEPLFTFDSSTELSAPPPRAPGLPQGRDTCLVHMAPGRLGVPTALPLPLVYCRHTEVWLRGRLGLDGAAPAAQHLCDPPFSSPEPDHISVLRGYSLPYASLTDPSGLLSPGGLVSPTGARAAAAAADPSRAQRACFAATVPTPLLDWAPAAAYFSACAAPAAGVRVPRVSGDSNDSESDSDDEPETPDASAAAAADGAGAATLSPTLPATPAPAAPVALVVNLTELHSLHDAAALAAAPAAPVAYAWCPVPDYRPPSLAQCHWLAALALLCRRGGAACAFHCAAGRGRTGVALAAAAVLRAHLAGAPLAPGAAVAAVRAERPLSVETEEQEAVIDAYAALLERLRVPAAGDDVRDDGGSSDGCRCGLARALHLPLTMTDSVGDGVSVA